MQETCRKLARLYQTASEIYFVYNKRQNLVLSGLIWPAASLNFPSNFWSRKPDGTSNFLSGSVWHDFVWLSGPWCSQGIRRKLLFKKQSILELFTLKNGLLLNFFCSSKEISSLFCTLRFTMSILISKRQNIMRITYLFLRLL